MGGGSPSGASDCARGARRGWNAHTRLPPLDGFHGLVILLVLAHHVRSVFGHRPYGAYLWHLPVFTVTQRYLADVPVAGRALVGCAITAILTSLSWFLVERPVLRWKRRLDHGHHGRSAFARAVSAPWTRRWNRASTSTHQTGSQPTCSASRRLRYCISRRESFVTAGAGSVGGGSARPGRTCSCPPPCGTSITQDEMHDHSGSGRRGCVGGSARDAEPAWICPTK